MDIEYCADCKNTTVVVFDHRTGDAICCDCGLVIESHYIDTTAEWRKFDDCSADVVDPTRVGVAVNPLLDTGEPTAIVISAAKNNKKSDVPRGSLPTSAADKSFNCALHVFDQMSDGLGLPGNISNDAKCLYKKASDHKKPKGKQIYAVVAACLYLACKDHDVPRSIKELEAVSIGYGCTVKAINKAKNDLVKIVEVGNKAKPINARNMSRRCCSRLGMDNDMKHSVSEILRNLEEQSIDIRRQPSSVLAAVMYMVAQLYNQKVDLQELSGAADVQAATTLKAYKDLYPYASRIVPNKFKFAELNLKP